MADGRGDTALGSATSHVTSKARLDLGNDAQRQSGRGNGDYRQPDQGNSGYGLRSPRDSGYPDADRRNGSNRQPSPRDSGYPQPDRRNGSNRQPSPRDSGYPQPDRRNGSNRQPSPRDSGYPQPDRRNGRYQRPGYEAGHDGRFENSRQPSLARPSSLRPEPESALDRRPTPGETPESPQPGGRPWLPTAATTTLVVAANVLALSGIRLQYVGPALGFWFLVVLPAYLLCTTNIWRGSPGVERIGYSVTSVILLLMLGGLTISTILPPLGVARPLDTVPVVIFADVLNITLYVFRFRRRTELPRLTQIRRLRPSETRLIVAGLFCVLLAILGTNRVNNDAGVQVSIAALVCIVATILVLLGRHRRLGEGVINATLYLVSLAILLMTSLRGWYVTGGDIQSEYRVFQFTEAHSRWSIADALHSAYNACLSITILPTEIERVVNVDSVYVFRFFFQLLFALCPVLAYAFWRRYASKLVALVAVIYFIGFPVYINDMPGINRQEIAFLFVGAAALAITNSRWPQGWRRLGLFVAAIGVELSHYSTMYMFVGTLVVGWLLGSVVRLRSRRNSKRAESTEEGPWTTARRTIGVGSVLAAISIMLLWGGLATQTVGPLLTDVQAAVSQFGHPGANTPYSLFSRTTLSTQQVLDNYISGAMHRNATWPGHLYFPTSEVARYSTPLDNEPNMPLTKLGRLLSRLGVPVTAVNTDVRQGAAKDEQLFVVAGFVAFIISRRLRRRANHELLFIGAASIVMVAVFTVFPNLSADYNASRALQEALIWAAPVLAVGTIAVFWPFGPRTGVRIAVGVSVAIFISTSGLLPQILGGYGPQLSLNNSGQYYDVDYMHPQEVAAVSWLTGKPGVLPGGLQAPMGPTTSDPFAFNSLTNVAEGQAVGDIYPALVKRASWVILSYAILHTDRAAVWTDGQIITYRYPTAFLKANKNLVYDNGGAEIYR